MSLFTSSRNQHRKFIALVLSLSIALTGVSAVPARADEDVAKFIAGMAVLGILGAAINDARADTRQPAPVQSAPAPAPVHVHRHPHSYPAPYAVPRHPGVRPMPPHVAKYNLPAQCVRYFPRYSKSHTLVGQNCLQKSYLYEARLPRACQVTFWNGHKYRSGYKPGCLQNHGYRLVRR